MNEQDNIKELFSKGLENHASPVRPEVWNGLQAKMAAAGIASGSAVAAKGLSALAKWFIGGTAASVVTVGTVLLVNNNTDEPVKDKQIAAADKIAGIETPSETDATMPENVETAPAKGNTAVNNTIISAPVNTPGTIIAPGQINRDRSPSWIWNERIGDGNPGSGSPEDKQGAGPGQTPGTVVNPPADNIAKKNPGTESPVITDAMPPKPASRSEISKIPNVFTPDHDGNNDYYFIESKFLSDFSIVIMGDKGAVFKSADPDFKWDGVMMDGQDAPDGNYIALIIAKGENGEYLKERQPLTIKR